MNPQGAWKGTENLHQGKEKGFGEKGLKIIKAERQKDKQVRDICKKHFFS